MKAVKPQDLERVIVDTTVQEKAIAHPVDSRLLEIARHKVVSAAKRAGISLKQTFAKEGKQLRRKAGGYAHAKQFRRLKRTVKRQRTILGIVIREVRRKFEAPAVVAPNAIAASSLMTWLERAERIRTQRTHDKNKLYALHASEVECIGKGKARKPYEFGVKNAIVTSHEHGLMLGARTFPGNPYDGHILSAVLEQAANLMQDTTVVIKQVVVDLGFRGVDAENPGKEIIHRGRFKSLSPAAKRLAAQAPGDRACHRAPESRSPAGPLLVARCAGRCAARRQLCGRVQPTLVAARRRSPEHRAGFFVPASNGAVHGNPMARAATITW
jgi:IS5 family transposase